MELNRYFLARCNSHRNNRHNDVLDVVCIFRCDRESFAHADNSSGSYDNAVSDYCMGLHISGSLVRIHMKLL